MFSVGILYGLILHSHLTKVFTSGSVFCRIQHDLNMFILIDCSQ